MPAVLDAIVTLAGGGDLPEGLEVSAGTAERSDLSAVWARIPDPRDARGRRHRLAAVLGLVQAAVVAGQTSWEAIMHWIEVASQETLCAVGAWRHPRSGRYVAPHPDTVAGLLGRLDMNAVDAAYAAHQAGLLRDLYFDDDLIPVAVDGKTQRGSAGGGNAAGHRLGAHLAEDGLTLAQLDVHAKSNEITAFTTLLDQVPDLTNVVVPADRMHTQRAHARYLASRGAFYVLPVGGNQPTLFAKLDALNWANVPICASSGWMTFDQGHGRRELRTIQVLPAPAGLNFPDIRQVFLLERHTYDLNDTMLRTEAILAITSLTARQATPERLTALVRAEWSIENRDHHVRDTTLAEDARKVHTGSLPSLLAVMGSHAIHVLRLLGFTNIAAGTRWARDDQSHPLIALGLTS